MFKKALAIIITVCLAGLSAGGCGNSVGSTPDEASSKASAETTEAPTAAKAETNLPKPDMSPSIKTLSSWLSSFPPPTWTRPTTATAPSPAS